jgi:hypothetical protein
MKEFRRCICYQKTGFRIINIFGYYNKLECFAQFCSSLTIAGEKGAFCLRVFDQSGRLKVNNLLMARFIYFKTILVALRTKLLCLFNGWVCRI